MADKIITPYGSNGQSADGLGIVDNLSAGGRDKALSAEMGKVLLGVVHTLWDSLGESAFWNGKPDFDWSSVGLLTHTITRTIEHGHSSSTLLQIANGTPLTETIIFDEGYVLNTLTVTMGGVAVSASYISGNTISIPSVTGPVVITATATSAKTITLSLTGCSSSNNAAGVSEGESYTTKIDANEDYQCVRPNISVKMGGVDLPVVLTDGYPLNEEPVTDSSASGYNHVDIANENCVIYKADYDANAAHRYRPYYEVSIKNVTGNIVITASVMNILADDSIPGTQGQSEVGAGGNVANRSGWCHTEIYIPMMSTSCRWYFCGVAQSDTNVASARSYRYIGIDGQGGYWNVNTTSQNYRDLSGSTEAKTRLARLSFKFNNGTLTGCGLSLNGSFIFEPNGFLPANS